MARRAHDLESTTLHRGEARMSHYSSFPLVMTVRFLWVALVIVGAISTAADHPSATIVAIESCHHNVPHARLERENGHRAGALPVGSRHQGQGCRGDGT